jgi:hypothetical protein
MKKFPIALAAIATLLAAAPAFAANVCLDVNDIVGQSSPDGNTIVFHMRDGSVWRNVLQRPCPDLKFNGFAWTITGPHEVCENEQILRVLHSGEICSLGKFEIVPPPRHR